MLIKLFRKLALISSVFLMVNIAQAEAPYHVLNPTQATETGKNIEVIEFFWYGCPHCYALEPDLNAWLKKLPKDVLFRRIPAVTGSNWALHAKLFYTLEVLNLIDRLHKPVFDATHKDHIELRDEKILLDWIEKQGVNRKTFADTYHSFGVENKVKRAQQLTRDYHLDGVPMLVVNGKYVTSPSAAGGEEQVFLVLDQLINKARKEKSR